MTDIASPSPSETSWEMVSPSGLALVDTIEVGDEVLVLPRPQLSRRRSASTPDLISYERQVSLASEEKNDDVDEFFDAAQDTLPSSSSKSMKKTMSWRDMVLSQVDELAKEVEVITPLQKQQQQQPKLKMKVKPKYVVTPIRRCTMSTPNLRSLAEEEDDDEVLGDTDAMEYYNRKAKGYSGHKNGMKLRPDEAKRKDITMYKKELQRAAQRG